MGHGFVTTLALRDAESRSECNVWRLETMIGLSGRHCHPATAPPTSATLADVRKDSAADRAWADAGFFRDGDRRRPHRRWDDVVECPAAEGGFPCDSESGIPAAILGRRRGALNARVLCDAKYALPKIGPRRRPSRSSRPRRPAPACVGPPRPARSSPTGDSPYDRWQDELTLSQEIQSFRTNPCFALIGWQLVAWQATLVLPSRTCGSKMVVLDSARSDVAW